MSEEKKELNRKRDLEKKHAKVIARNQLLYGQDTVPNEVRQKKYEQTMLLKYGTKHSTGVKEIQERAKQTLINKYGVENPRHIEGVQDKIEATNRKKYGVSNPTQSKQVQQKQKQTKLKNAAEARKNQLLSNGYELLEEYNGSYIDGIRHKYTIKHIECGTVFNRDFSNPVFCPTCYPGYQFWDSTILQ
jgi:hypothetical protein